MNAASRSRLALLSVELGGFRRVRFTSFLPLGVLSYVNFAQQLF